MVNDNNGYERRRFLKQSFLATAFVGLGPSVFPFPSKPETLAPLGLQQRFLSASLIWDAANLIMKDTGKTWKLMDSISERFNMMFSGNVLLKRPEYHLSMLEQVKQGGGWDSDTHPKWPCS